MLVQVMYRLIMEVISPRDTSTIYTYSSKILQSLAPFRPIDHVIKQEPGFNLQCGQICDLSEVELEPLMA
jgi:hypothetical protein